MIIITNKMILCSLSLPKKMTLSFDCQSGVPNNLVVIYMSRMVTMRMRMMSMSRMEMTTVRMRMMRVMTRRGKPPDLIKLILTMKMTLTMDGKGNNCFQTMIIMTTMIRLQMMTMTN